MDNEFRYYASSLLFGKNSPYTEEFKIYSVDIFRQCLEIKFNELALVNASNKYDIKRSLHLNNHQLFIVDQCILVNKIGGRLSFIDSTNHVNLSDHIFLNEEKDQKRNGWSIIAKNKIEYLSLLIHAIYFKHLYEVPAFMYSFTNISSFLLENHFSWDKS